jgi:hypothetical protein
MVLAIKKGPDAFVAGAHVFGAIHGGPDALAPAE